MYKKKINGLKYCLLAGLFAVFAGVVPVSGAVANATENNNVNEVSSVAFDENNITFTFGAISDPHLRNYAKVMNVLNDWNDGEGMDALIIAGDLTDRVLYDKTTAEIPTLKYAWDMVIPSDVDTFFCLGNHDSSAGSYANDFYTMLGDRYYSTDLDKETAKTTGNRHSVIGGYHFIAVEAAYKGTLPENSLTYLRDTLQSITTDPAYGGEYIFVVCHVAPGGTVLGGVQYSDMDEVLKQYPQAILFSGHTHAPLHDERSIMQDEYTVINLGSTFYSWFEDDRKYLEVSGDGMVSQSYSICVGSMVEVDANGNVRITRIDFNTGEIIKKPWILSAPQADKSHLIPYSNMRATTFNEAPTVKEDAEVSLQYVSETSMKITFDRGSDDDMVKSYVIQLYAEDSTLPYAQFESLSEFYLYPDLSNMPETKTVTLNNLTRLPAGVRIYAQDSFGAMSKPMETPKLINTQRPTADCFKVEANTYALADKYEASLSSDFSSLIENTGSISDLAGEVVYVRIKETATLFASEYISINVSDGD